MALRLWLLRLSTPTVGLGLLMLATVGVYAPHVARAAFVYEDSNDVNTLYRADPWRDQAHDFLRRPTSRVLTSLTYRLIGFDPVRQHATNLALHLLNGLLLFIVARRFVAPWASVVAVGLFWLHPAGADAVAYASARADLLLTTATLLGLWAVCRERVGWAFVAACLAVTVKESGVAVLLLLPFVAWWRGDEWSPRARIAWTLAITVPTLAPLLADYRPWTPGTFLWPTAMSVGRNIAQFAEVARHVVWPFGLTVLPSTAWITPEITATSLCLALLALCYVGIFLRTWPGLLAASTVLLALPRLLLPLREGWHLTHLYVLLPLLMMGAASVLTRKVTHG